MKAAIRVVLTEDLKRRLDREASARLLSASAVARQALMFYFEAQETERLARRPIPTIK